MTCLVVLLLSPGVASPRPAGQDPSTGVRAALSYLPGYRAELGLHPGDVSDVVVTDAYRSKHNGVTHVYLRQRHRGLEVLGGDMTVNVARDGSILMAGSRFLSDLASEASGRISLGPVGAAQAAARQLGLGATNNLRVLRQSVGASMETLLSDGGVSDRPIPARLAYQPTAGGGLRLVWNLEIEETSGGHWWNASIDAATGKLLAKTDYVVHDDREHTARAIEQPGGSPSDANTIWRLGAPESANDGAAYRVYALPLESPNDGPRTLEMSPADSLGSPFGWHDTNASEGPEFTITRGNNVHAYADTNNDNGPDPLGDPDGGPTLQFDYPIDFRLTPLGYRDAAVTNLFYWNNIAHDVFYRYGFDEAAGNFQVNTYGRGGAGNDDVQAEAQDRGNIDNANFATPPDGSRPRMQMYLWPSTATDADTNRDLVRDGDLDAGIIVHEYGHGISNRLTAGPSNVSCLANQEQMGEGWSDWLALAITALPGDSGAQARGLGTYASHQASRTSQGLRPTAYSTDETINPATYDSIKTEAVPHGVGYVWATMLWEVYWDLVATYGFNPDPYGDWTTGGNNLAIQLVMDGMKMQVCRPGFVNARDAILAADLALTGGENQCLVWRGFAKRGLGYSADQGSSTSRTDGTEAFDTHPNCRP